MRRRRFFVFAAVPGLCRPNPGALGSCFGAFFFAASRYLLGLKTLYQRPDFVSRVRRHSKMSKILFVIPLILITSAASAQQQQQQRQQGHDACARDVSRHCRAQMQDGDQIVLACLKQNRAKISKGCQQMLASHGQ
jgi:hypothetical protein